jgi:predicted nucleic acid-binding protein
MAVLVDTSVWIRFFRQPDSQEARTLDLLLAAGPVATCLPIRAEVLSGAPTRREFDRLRDLFGALALLDLPSNAWLMVEEHRFLLARRGFQASLVDVLIALTAAQHQAELWTLDDDFRQIATAIPFRRYESRLST